MSSDPEHFGQHDDTVYLWIAIDYGAKMLKASYRIGRKDDILKSEDIIDVEWAPGRTTTEQRLALLTSGNARSASCGSRVHRGLRDGTIKDEDVIPSIKLTLISGVAGDEYLRKAQPALDKVGMTRIELLAEHLRVIRRAILRHVTIRVGRDVTTQQRYPNIKVFEMPKKFIMTVPHTWNLTATRAMTMAAELAEFENVELMSEAECAVAYYLSTNDHACDTDIQAGDGFVVLDLGGGTCDATSMVLVQDAGRVASIRLKVDTHDDRGRTGTELTKRVFAAAYNRQIIEKETELRSDELVYNRAIRGSDTRLLRLPKQLEDRFEDQVLNNFIGALGHGARLLSSFGISLGLNMSLHDPDDGMEALFDKVFAEMCENVLSTRAAPTKLLIVTGGMIDVPIFRGQRGSSYSSARTLQDSRGGILFNAISRGALLRYNSIALEQANRKRLHFGIVRHEYLDRYRYFHLFDSVRIAKVVQSLVLKIARISVGTYVPTNHWLSIGENVSPQSLARRLNWRTYFGKENNLNFLHDGDYGRDTIRDIPKDSRTLDFELFCTENHLSDHSPIWNDQGRLLGGIHSWGTVSLALPDLEILGYKLLALPDKTLGYRVFSKVFIECDGKNARLIWKIRMPQTGSRLGRMFGVQEYEYITLPAYDVINEKFVPYVRAGAH